MCATQRLVELIDRINESPDKLRRLHTASQQLIAIGDALSARCCR
jgi:hypothetical protein